MELREISGLPGYFCDNSGGVYSTKLGGLRKMKLRKGSRGYLVVALRKPRGGYKYALVHRLIATAWISEPPFEAAEVNHKNGDKTDNRIENLEWLSRKENERHAWRVLGKNTRGSRHRLAKLTEEDVAEMRELRAKGWTLERLSERYDIGISHTLRVVNREVWRHVA